MNSVQSPFLLLYRKTRTSLLASVIAILSVFSSIPDVYWADFINTCGYRLVCGI